jgi:hypothetical protein
VAKDLWERPSGSVPSPDRWPATAGLSAAVNGGNKRHVVRTRRRVQTDGVVVLSVCGGCRKERLAHSAILRPPGFSASAKLRLVASRALRAKETPTTRCQHNNTSASRPDHRRVAIIHRLHPPSSGYVNRQRLKLRKPNAADEALCPFYWAVRDQLFIAICGYATITDWTASAPISRHSGYRHHHRGTANQER